MLYRILLFSVKPHHESAIGIHKSPPFWTSLLFPSPLHLTRLMQSPCLSFLSHTENSHWLSILHMVMQVSLLLFPYISPSPSLSLCLLVYSLRLFLHCCLVNKFFSTLSLDSISMCVRIRYLSFTFWLTSLCIVGSRFIHFIRTDSNVLPFMSKYWHHRLDGHEFE